MHTRILIHRWLESAMRPAVAHQERPQTAFDMRQVQRELDGHADQLELQERINTAENLPLGPNEWQHDHAGKDLLHTQL